MNCCRQIHGLNRLRGFTFFSTTGSLHINQKWRQMRGLPEQPNHDSKLLNLPDYSYLDGRPTPYGTNQRLRIEKQKTYTAKILELSSEMDLAMELHKKREAAKQASVEKRISQKLKEKGNKIVDD